MLQMYHRAQVYDLVYAWKDYKAEAETIQSILKEHGITDNISLIEAGCGTCSHLVHFSNMFDYVCGFDLYQEMINFAEEKLAGKTNHKLFKADMIDLEVPNILHEYHNGKPFDVVVSLFGCIGYIIGRNNLEKVFQNFYDLVKEDGLVIVENFLLPDDFNPGSVHMHTHDGEDLKIARISKTKYKFPHPQNEDEQDQIELDFNFMVGKTHDESSVDHFVDVHHMQLYREEFVRQCAEKIGFKEFKALRVNRFRLLYVIKK